MFLIYIYCITATVYSVFGNTIANETGPDYCNQELYCSSKKGPHIACNNPGEFSPECPEDAEIIAFNDYHIDKITDLHNFYRNQIASGEVQGFAGATRMAKMVWNDDLAYLAELHVKRCLFEHDSCRNTDEFKYAGQNIYMFAGYPSPSDIHETMDLVYDGVSEWYSEFQNANMSVIKSFYRTAEPTGHFTTMMLEQNTCLGCAANMYSDKTTDLQETRILFTCVYATNNINGYRTYEDGEPGSKCVNGTDYYYNALCSENEYFDPNQHYKADN